MKRMVERFGGGWRLVAFLMLALAPVHAIAQPVHIMYGLIKDTNDLIRFNSLTPGTIEETIHLTGVLADEALRAIDFRQTNGQLYALGTDDVSHAPRVYQIDLETRVATPRVRTLPGTNMPADWGMTFINDRPRIVSSLGQNMTAGLIPVASAASIRISTRPYHRHRSSMRSRPIVSSRTARRGRSSRSIARRTASRISAA